MTEQEAIGVLAEFRKAFNALDQMKTMRAVNALLNPGPVVTTGALRAREFASALATLKTAFDEMDRKGIRFPSS
jgi:hypothetical protein